MVKIVEQFYVYMDFKNSIIEEDLTHLEKNFHTLIYKVINDDLPSINTSKIALPKLTIPFDTKSKQWIGIEGMYGGFSYAFDDSDSVLKLIVENWCRIFDGLGKKHIVTAEGFLCVGANIM